MAVVPTFRGVGTWVVTPNSVSSSENLSPTKSGSTVNGDCMVLVVDSRQSLASCTTPTGWTLVNGFAIRSANTKGGSFHVFTRIADGGANDAPTVTVSGLSTGTSGDSTGAQILSYSNMTPARDGTPAFSDLSAQTTSSTIPAMTTAVNNSMVIALSFKLDTETGTSSVTTFTERSDNMTTNGTGHILNVSDKVQTTAGSTGTATASWTDTNSNRALMVTMAFAAVPEVVLQTSPATSGGSASLQQTFPAWLGGSGTAYGYVEEAVRLTQKDGGGNPGGAFWTLEATNGGTDQTGNGRTAALGSLGPSAFGGYTTDSPLVGRPVEATDYDNVDDTVNVTGYGGTAFGGTVRSYFGWARRTTGASTDTLMATPGTGSIQTSLQITSTGVIRWAPFGTGGTLVNWTGWPALNQWVFWTLTINQSTGDSTFYINGTSLGTQNIASWTWPSNSDLKLGARAGTAEPWSGQKQGYGVVHATLTAAEVARLYNYGPHPPLYTPAQSAATISLFAPTITFITLQSSDAVSGGSAAPDTPEIIPLQASPAQSAATANLTAKTAITLQTSPAQSDATLTLRAKTEIPLQTSPAQSSATAEVRVPVTMAVQSSAAQSAATAVFTAKTAIPLQTSPAQSAATITLTAPPVQFLTPTADSVDGAWLNSDEGTTLYTYVSDQSDPTFIHSEYEPTNSTCRIRLAPGAVPDAGTRTLRTRYRADGTSRAVGLTIRLYQGGGDTLGAGTLVDTFSHSSIPTSLTTVEDIVTGTITNYSALYVELEAD
jgi:hypothetical protein